MPRGSINNEINIFTGGGTGAAGSVGGSAGLVDSGEVNKSTEELRRNAAQVRKTRRSWSDWGRTINGTHLTLTKFVVVLNRVAFALISFKIISTVTRALEGFTSQIIKGNAQMEVMNAQLEQFLGSSVQASRARRFIIQEAITTPFEIPDIIQAGRALNLYGQSMSDLLRTTLDTAAALVAFSGGTQDLGGTLDKVTDAMGRVILQVQGWGRSLTNVLKIPMPEFQDALRETENRAEALQKILNERFGGFSEKLSATVIGRLSNINDIFGIMARRMSALTFAEIQKDVEKLFIAMNTLDTTTIDRLALAFRRLYEDVKGVGDIFKTVNDGLKSIDVSIGELLKAIAWFFAIKTGFNLFVRIFSPGGIISTVILAVGIALGVLAQKMDIFGIKAKVAGENTKEAIATLKEFKELQKVGLENIDPDRLDLYSIKMRAFADKLREAASEAVKSDSVWHQWGNKVKEFLNSLIRGLNYILQSADDIRDAIFGILLDDTGMAGFLKFIIRFFARHTNMILKAIEIVVDNIRKMSAKVGTFLAETFPNTPIIKDLKEDYIPFKIDLIDEKDLESKIFGAIEETKGFFDKIFRPLETLEIPEFEIRSQVEETESAYGLLIAQMLKLADTLDESADKADLLGQKFQDQAEYTKKLNTELKQSAFRYRGVVDSLIKLYELREKYNVALDNSATLQGLLRQYYVGEEQALNNLITSFGNITNERQKYVTLFEGMITQILKKIQTLPEDIRARVAAGTKAINEELARINAIKDEGFRAEEFARLQSAINSLDFDVNQLGVNIDELQEKGILKVDEAKILQLIIQQLEVLIGEVERATEFINKIRVELGQNLYNTIISLTAPIESMWASLIQGGKTFGQVMRGIFNQLLQDITRLIMRALILSAVFNFIPGLGKLVMPGLGGDFGFGNILKFITGFDFLAGGGRVYPNQPVIVGDRGAEMFVPKTSGRIYSNQQTQKMGGGSITVPVYIDGREVARAVHNYNERQL